MSRLLSPLFLVLTLVFLSACTRYEVMVNGFRNVNEPMPIQTTFAIFPVENQKTDLEFQEYARMVEVKMQEKGYRKSDINSADIAILLNYGIDEGVTKYSASSGPVYGTRTFSGTAMGSGGTGTVSGTHGWTDRNMLFLVALDNDPMARLVNAVKKLHAELVTEHGEHEVALKAFLQPCELIL